MATMNDRVKAGAPTPPKRAAGKASGRVNGKPAGAVKAGKPAGAAKTVKPAKTVGGQNGDAAETAQGPLFQPVVAPTRVDYPLLEHDIQHWWDEHDIAEIHAAQRRTPRALVLHRRPDHRQQPDGRAPRLGPHLQGPLPALPAMRGRELRYQNGFDCQGLWVEVEVEKELGFKSQARHRDLRRRRVRRAVQGARAASIRPCRREQSIRLGYWMDWDNCTSPCPTRTTTPSGCSSRSATSTGWIYKGHDAMPWCPAAARASPSTRSHARATGRSTHTSRLRQASRSMEPPGASTCWSGRRRPGRWRPTSPRRSTRT